MALSKPTSQYTDGGISIPVYDVTTKTVPTALTSEISVDCRLRHLKVTNPVGGTTRTLTVQDGKGNLLYTAILGAEGVFAVDFSRPGSLCPSGIQWQTSGGTDLVGEMMAEGSNPA